MVLNGKIVLAHCGFYDAECKNQYRENSAEVCKVSASRKEIDIIELDLRKSKDGVLYCYHGTLPQYHFSLRFPMRFSTLQRKYQVGRFIDILDVITRDKTVFLDIKDKNVTREDLENAFKGRHFKEVILGNKSPSFLRQYDPLPKNFVKILNGNIFCNFYNSEKLRKEGFKYFEVVFPFQLNDRLVKRLQESGLELRCAGLFFRSKKSYFDTIEKYKIKHISSDFI